ncbi:hypothetical protein MTR67_018424 [Solanum verrucosum]|uniref:Uncharacterized protein n=1 Tax=Solanum verrucosum TaxID=315347 RepID=A0AAF0QS61_SOLVR|nr:hypothetical protein MTR67_018424 [Solanum verrucosum]
MICLFVNFITFMLFPSTFSRFEALGDRITTLWNCLVTRRLFYFIAELTFSFRAQHIGIKGDIQAYRRLISKARRSSGLRFFVLFSGLVPFCQVVSMLCLKL